MQGFIRKWTFLTLAGVCISSLAAAQTQDSYDYNSEFTWAINKNS